MNDPTTHPAPPDKNTLLQFYRMMRSIRSFEEHVQDLYTRALILGITHVSIGQEAIAAGVCSALRRDDFITSTHRGHGHCLAKGAQPERMFAELFGKADGYCHGKGGSMHIADPDTGNLGANAIVGGSLAIAAGAALSAKRLKRSQVAVCFFGDGAANQGQLLESMNMAALWRLPVIYVCEHNKYGEYTSAELVTAGDLLKRGEAFDIPSFRVDGMDVLKVYQAASTAVERARVGEGPSFLVCDTYRYFGHGMSDRDRAYRTRAEEKEWRQRDALERFAHHLIENGHASQPDLELLDRTIEKEMVDAIASAQAGPNPVPADVRKHVYAN